MDNLIKYMKEYINDVLMSMGYEDEYEVDDLIESILETNIVITIDSVLKYAVEREFERRNLLDELAYKESQIKKLSPDIKDLTMHTFEEEKQEEYDADEIFDPIYRSTGLELVDKKKQQIPQMKSVSGRECTDKYLGEQENNEELKVLLKRLIELL